MTWTKRFFSPLLVLFVVGCSKHARPPTRLPESVVPDLRVDISYSAQAMRELKRRGETVVVFGDTYGFPKKGAPSSLVDKMGEIGLGDLHAETLPGQVATIPSLTIDQNDLNFLTPAGVQVLINVVSGRKSSPDNLLACDIYDGPLQAVRFKTVPIHCKLIGE